MASHTDILDRPEGLRGPFWGSVTLHVLFIGSLFASAWLGRGLNLQMGSPTGGGLGSSVLVDPVASIPLPNRGGMENPVANDTESAVPEPPKVAPKTTPKVMAPRPDAIPLKDDSLPKRPSRAAAQPNKWREQQQFDRSQLYSSAGQRISSPAYGQTGGGGVRVGDSSPFGSQFGAYATLLRDQVARNWKTADLSPRLRTAPGVVVAFTIQKNGSVTNVKVVQPSGIQALDYSAMRAVYDAEPFAPLPPGFPRSSADVELTFELRR